MFMVIAGFMCYTLLAAGAMIFIGAAYDLIRDLFGGGR